MKKKFSIILISILTLVLVVGCSGGPKPEDTVSEFVEAMKSFDIETMNSKINPEDRGDIEDFSGMSDEIEDGFEEKFLEYIESNASKITYEINESEVDGDGDKAVVNVDFKYVDGAPLFKAAFRDYMKEVFALAFTNLDGDISDEENAEIFIASMDKQIESMEETFTEKALNINCINIEDQWYIDDPSDELLDVIMSNLLTTMEELDDSFDFDDEDTEDGVTEEELLEEDINLMDKTIGDEIELQTLNLKVTDVEETNLLSSEFGEDVAVKEGTKFVVLSMEVTNTTKSEIEFPDSLVLTDKEERQFNTYSDSYMAIDDSLEYEDLAPSIKESGRLVYEVPEDSKDYYMIIRKAETDDAYKIILKK